MNGNPMAGGDDDEMGGAGAGGGGGGGDIDLGQPGGGGLGAGMADLPQGGAAGPPTGPVYPSVMLSGDEGLSKIPDKGRAHINFHVASRRQHTPSEGKHKGKKRHEVELHLHSIRPMRAYKKAASKSKRSDDETAMAKLMGEQGEE